MSLRRPRLIDDISSNSSSSHSVASCDHASFLSEDDQSAAKSNDRDELKELRQALWVETKQVQAWRVLVSLVLLSTGLAVTAATFYLLNAAELENANEGVSM